MVNERSRAYVSSPRTNAQALQIVPARPPTQSIHRDNFLPLSQLSDRVDALAHHTMAAQELDRALILQ
jgi:hypothetical protein